jgi:hypothetical protein
MKVRCWLDLDCSSAITVDATKPWARYAKLPPSSKECNYFGESKNLKFDHV